MVTHVCRELTFCECEELRRLRDTSALKCKRASLLCIE